MAAGDPVPTGDTVTIQVTKEFAVDFLLNWMGKPPAKRPVLRMELHDAESGIDWPAGNWQVTSVASLRREAGYDTPLATLRAVFD